MSISAKRKLAVGAAGLAVLAGSGGAYAAAAGTPQVTQKPADHAAEQKAFLDDVAKRLNVTRDQLDAAVKGAAEARIDAAVAAGKLTKEQGDAAKKRLANGLPTLGGPGIPRRQVGAAPRRPRRAGVGHRGFGFGFGFEGAADYLGLTEAQLREQLAGRQVARRRRQGAEQGRRRPEGRAEGEG